MSFSARGRNAAFHNLHFASVFRRVNRCRRKPLAPCSHREIVSRSVGHSLIGPWLSLVERLVRDEEVASSNLAGPTNPMPQGRLPARFELRFDCPARSAHDGQPNLQSSPEAMVLSGGVPAVEAGSRRWGHR